MGKPQRMAPTQTEQAAPAEQPSAQNEEKKVVIMSTQGPVVKDAKAETEYAKNARGGGYNGGLVNFQSEGDTDFAANAFWRVSLAPPPLPSSRPFLETPPSCAH